MVHLAESQGVIGFGATVTGAKKQSVRRSSLCEAAGGWYKYMETGIHLRETLTPGTFLASTIS